MDPARFDSTLAALSWVHPIVMAGVILLTIAVYTTGLSIREARVRKRRIAPGTRRRHTRLSKPAVVAALAGVTLGPISSVLLRGWAPLQTFHGIAGLLAMASFTAAGLLGVRLESGRTTRAALHGGLGLLGVLLGLLAALAGTDLLP
jgi:hypothetical protein